MIDFQVNNHIFTAVQVEITPEAGKQLDELPKGIHGRVIEVLERLSKWPVVSGAKPLRHELKGNYRVRTGAYRIVFRVLGQRVIVWNIDNRKDVYG